MKERLKAIIKFIIRVGIGFAIVISIIFIIIKKFSLSQQDTVCIVGILFIFIGGANVFGDTGRRADFTYLYVRSMSARSSSDEIRNDKRELEHNNESIIELVIIGVLLIIVGLGI